MQIFVRFFAQTQMAVWSVEWGYRAEPVASGEEESGDIQRCIYGKSADLWWVRARDYELQGCSRSYLGFLIT